MSSSEISLAQAIKALRDLSSGPDLEFYYLGPSEDLTRTEVSRLIFKIEKIFCKNSSAELEFWLGISLRNYTIWFLRGEERAPALRRAVDHLENAYALSSGPSQGGLSRWSIALELGLLLMDEPEVEDQVRGIIYLKEAHLGTDEYDPRLCRYAEALLDSGDNLGAARTAVELIRMAEKSERWRDKIPLQMQDIASKACQAQAKSCEKSEDIGQAVSFLQRLLAMRADLDDKDLDSPAARLPAGHKD
jgi:hypothetical protein